MAKGKVLHVHEKFFPHMGGSTFRLSRLLTESKLKHLVLAHKHDPDLSSVGRTRNILIVRYSNILNMFALLIYLRIRWKPDITHLHNFRPGCCLLLPFFFDRRKIILELHSLYQPKNFLKKILSSRINTLAKNILVLSFSMKAKLGNNKHINIVENGYDANLFNLNGRPASNLTKDTIVVIYSGSLHGFQNIAGFVNIANTVSDGKYEFHVYGGTKQEITKYKKMNTSNNIFWHGWISEAELSNVYKKSDVLLMTRKRNLITDSVIPLKPIEAIASGCCVVSTELAGMWELSQRVEGNMVQFFDLENIQSFKEAVQRGMRANKELGLKQSKPKIEYYEVRAVAKKLDAIYTKVQNGNLHNTQ